MSRLENGIREGIAGQLAQACTQVRTDIAQRIGTVLDPNFQEPTIPADLIEDFFREIPAERIDESINWLAGWLYSEPPVFQGKMPIELLSSENPEETQYVKNILLRMLTGVYS